MKKERYFLPIVFCFIVLLMSTLAFAEDQKFTTENYQEDLHNQGLERVVIIFKDATNPSLVEKYNGTILNEIPQLSVIMAIIPIENVEPFKNEPEVKDLFPDIILQPQSDLVEDDPVEQATRDRLKKEYLRKIREERSAIHREALTDYLKAIRKYLIERKQILVLYNATLVKFMKTENADKQTYLTELLQYIEMLKECELKRKTALEEYKNKIELAKDSYITAAGELEIRVNEQITLMYSGPLEVKWNDLEAGCNAKAAWDRYNLDGTGVKIAFLDTGIDYTMENLDGNYLGGKDYAANPDDDNPMPATDGTENHGTLVASLAVGEGVVRVIGVAYNAGYYAIRVLPSDSSSAWYSDLISGINWASTEPHKADIISMSLIWYNGILFPPGAQALMEEACNNAYNQGIILVACSGNDQYSYSAMPAAFANVISVGGHDQYGNLYTNSNGGVDVIAPAAEVYSAGADNHGYFVWGTSVAVPHVDGLIALQLQYARQKNGELDYHMKPNNGYLWEVMKHSAKDMPLISDPNYKGNGKAWAADSIPPPVTPPPPLPWAAKDGSIDAMAEKWPLSYAFEYFNYLWLDQGLYPAYYIGTNMYQDITLTNNTDTAGNYIDNIENLDITTTQAYYQEYSEATLPGAAVELLYNNYVPPSYMAPAAQLTQSDSYYLPWAMYPGLDRTILDLEFEFTSDTNNRLIKVTYPYSSIWCPPPAINEDFPAQN